MKTIIQSQIEPIGEDFRNFIEDCNLRLHLAVANIYDGEENALEGFLAGLEDFNDAIIEMRWSLENGEGVLALYEDILNKIAQKPENATHIKKITKLFKEFKKKK
jgi:hypothetical protein